MSGERRLSEPDWAGHRWVLNEKGDVDWKAWRSGYHAGRICGVCGYTECWRDECNPPFSVRCREVLEYREAMRPTLEREAAERAARLREDDRP